MLLNRQLTLVGRSYFLIASLLAVNLAIWLVAIGLFSTSDRSRVLSLAAIAYTLGLRHALGRCIVAESIVDSNLLSLLPADADHIRSVQTGRSAYTCTTTDF